MNELRRGETTTQTLTSWKGQQAEEEATKKWKNTGMHFIYLFFTLPVLLRLRWNPESKRTTRAELTNGSFLSPSCFRLFHLLNCEHVKEATSFSNKRFKSSQVYFLLSLVMPVKLEYCNLCCFGVCVVKSPRAVGVWVSTAFSRTAWFILSYGLIFFLLLNCAHVALSGSRRSFLVDYVLVWFLTRRRAHKKLVSVLHVAAVTRSTTKSSGCLWLL